MAQWNRQQLDDAAATARDRLRDLDTQYKPLVRGRPELQAEWDSARAPLLATIAERDRARLAELPALIDHGRKHAQDTSRLEAELAQLRGAP